MTTGTPSTALNGLQPHQLCRIIEACKSANVASFELGPLKITFAQVVSKVAESNAGLQVQSQVDVGPITGSNEIESPTSLVTIADREVLEDMQRSQLMIDDPVAFEALMVDDHMQRQGTANGGTA